MPGEVLSTPPRRLRVALAEDDDDQRQALDAALTSEGFEVVSFEDGAELLDFFELASTRAADVIIADLNMPGRSGLDGLERARARGVTAPIFVVTGESSEDLRARVMRLGNALYLHKPIDAGRLAEAIYRVAALGP
ncbi:MAG: response regulator [Archangium sp.]|nr:response regulator [Archangium sp.]